MAAATGFAYVVKSAADFGKGMSAEVSAGLMVWRAPQEAVAGPGATVRLSLVASLGVYETYGQPSLGPKTFWTAAVRLVTWSRA